MDSNENDFRPQSESEVADRADDCPKISLFGFHLQSEDPNPIVPRTFEYNMIPIRGNAQGLELMDAYYPKQYMPGRLPNPPESKGDIQQRDYEHWTGHTCNDGHSWPMKEEISKSAQLEGHNQAVTGIALPAGSDKLYTGSKDGVLRVWDCHTSQCVNELNLGSEIRCLTSNGSWIFTGHRDSVKVWNIQTETEYSLNGVHGQVNALEMSQATGEDRLYAGMQDGSILVWKYISETNSFQLITTLKGHTSDVLSLKAGQQFLYSGSADNTIRRWDLDTLQCIQTLTGHSAPIRSLLCWQNFVFSGSLDKTIKVWNYTEAGDLGFFNMHNEEHGVLALFGMDDADSKPILFCSCTDNSIHVYELPGFTERDQILAKQAVLTMMSSPEGLFFTGDVAGGVAVWKWLHKQTAEAN